MNVYNSIFFDLFSFFFNQVYKYLVWLQDIILHVSASKIKLLEAAEHLELQKKDKFGRLRDFTVGHLEDFLLDENMSVDDLLTTSEKQTIVKHELDNIRATSQDNHIPG